MSATAAPVTVLTERQDPTRLGTFHIALAEALARGYSFEAARAVYEKRTGTPCPFYARAPGVDPKHLLRISLDFETRSACDLTEHGAHVYAAHPSTRILCMAWALDGEPQVWIEGLEFPPVLRCAIESGALVSAWNAEFEQVIWQHIGVARWGFPVIHPHQWRDAMAAAAAAALPQGLDRCGEAIGAPVQKDKAGHALMLKMSRPRKATRTDDSPWHDDGDSYQRLYQYCQQDVKAERSIASMVPSLSAEEQRVWLHHSGINHRGIGCDRQGVNAALRIIALAETDYRHQVDIATGGLLADDDLGSHVKLKEWLLCRGISMPSVAKDAVDAMLAAGGLPDDVRTVLTARRALGRTSTKKYQAMLDRMSADDRIRGAGVYHGASTGRWTHRGVQMQNMVKGDYSPAEVDQCFQDMAALGLDDFRFLWGDPMTAAAWCLRGALCAGPGKILIAADYSGIEARIVNWIAGQADIVQAWRDKDAGTGADLYCLMASAIFGKPAGAISKTKERPLGKICELGCGFSMGAERLMEQANENPEMIAAGITLTIEQAKHAVQTYRETHSYVKQFWYDIESAAVEAVRTGNQTGVRDNAIRFKTRGPHLLCRLPSGRCLSYPFAEIRDRTTPWGKVAPGLSYMGVDQTTKQWRREDSYGGLLTENVVQAMARDIMAAAVVRCEEACDPEGVALWPIVLTVHDEIVAEVDESRGTKESLDEFCKIITTLPTWAASCPITAGGFFGKRYRK